MFRGNTQKRVISNSALTGTAQPSNTVQGELKLSVKLQAQIDEQKNLIEKQTEELEESNYFRNTYFEELTQLRIDFQK
jgi:hypothetical protein